MTWETSFDTRGRRWFWEAVAQQMIGNAASNLQSFVSCPLRYQQRTLLPASSSSVALEAWPDFVWDKGGGMPFPVTESDSSEERGDSITYQFGLKERISSIDRDQCLVRIETTNSGFPSPSPLRLKRNPILRHSRRWPSGADLGSQCALFQGGKRLSAPSPRRRSELLRKTCACSWRNLGQWSSSLGLAELASR